MVKNFYIVQGPNCWDRSVKFDTCDDAMDEIIRRWEQYGHHGTSLSGQTQHLRLKTHKYPSLPEMSGYTAKQQAVIRATINQAAIDGATQMYNYAWSDNIVNYRNSKQRFAIFGTTARELLSVETISDLDRGVRFDYIPVILAGKMLEQCPDEGRSGILYLMRMNIRNGLPHPGKWSAFFLSTGWVYTRELEMSPRDVANNIAEEVYAGHSSITGGRPGWI